MKVIAATLALGAVAMCLALFLGDRWGRSASTDLGPQGHDATAETLDGGARLETRGAEGERTPAEFENDSVLVHCSRKLGDVETPLEGAEVEVGLFDADTREATAVSSTTNAHGWARVPTRGDVLGLRASARGHLAATARGNEIDLNEALHLTLQPLASLEVVVTGPNGDARPGARVCLVYGEGLAAQASRMHPDDVPPGERQYKHADAAGRVRLASALPGVPIVIEVQDDLYGRLQRQAGTLEPGEQRLEALQLEPGGAITVRFLDGKDVPIVQALTTVYRKHGTGWNGVAKSLTDAEGRVAVPGLRPGVHAVTCVGWNLSASELFAGQLEFEVTPDERRDLGEVRIRFGPFVVDLTAEGTADGHRLVIASFSQERDLAQERVRRMPYRAEMPVGRPFQVWLDAPGDYRWALSLATPQHKSIDREFVSFIGEAAVPGALNHDFVRRKEAAPPELAVTLRLPGDDSADPSASQEDRGFFALLADGVPTSVSGDLRSRAPSTLAFLGRAGANHHLRGVLDGRSFDLQVPDTGEHHFDLSQLEETAAARLRCALLLPGGEVATAGRVELVLGESRASVARQLVVEDATVEFDFPPDLGGRLRLTASDGKRYTGSFDPQGGAGLHEVRIQLGPERRR